MNGRTTVMGSRARQWTHPLMGRFRRRRCWDEGSEMDSEGFEVASVGVQIFEAPVGVDLRSLGEWNVVCDDHSPPPGAACVGSVAFCSV
jgi:hypothetical protein